MVDHDTVNAIKQLQDRQDQLEEENTQLRKENTELKKRVTKLEKQLLYFLEIHKIPRSRFQNSRSSQHHAP